MKRIFLIFVLGMISLFPALAQFEAVDNGTQKVEGFGELNNRTFDGFKGICSAWPVVSITRQVW